MDQERSRSAANPDVLVALDAKSTKAADDSSFALLRSNIIEAIRILVLRRWAFFVPFCLVTCLAAIGSHWLSRSYESMTIIERRDHPVLLNLRQTPATGEFARFFRPTLINDLKSPEALVEVVARTGLMPDLEFDTNGALTEASMQRCRPVATALASAISVQLQQSAEHFDQIRIAYRSENPDIPQRVIEEVKNTYIHRTRTRLIEMLEEARAYFSEVSRKRREEITKLEEELLTFQSQYIGVDPTDPGALKLKITSLESEQAELQRELVTLARELETREQLLTAYQQRREQMRKGYRPAAALDLNLPSMAKSQAAKDLEDAIRKLQDEIHELQLTRRMTDRHPEIVERRERIERLREDLKAQYLADAQALPANQGMTLDPLAADTAVEEAVGLDVELASLQMGVQDRASRLAEAQSRLRIVEADLAKHRALEENVFRYRREYKLKADMLAQAQVDLNNNTRRVMEISSILNADESERGISFSMLVPPTPSGRPVNPKGSTILVFALLAGLAAGALSVLFRELFDQTYHTTRQITRSLGLAMLECIDEIVTSADRARRLRRRVLFAPVVVSVLLLAVGVSCAAAYLSVEQPRAYQRLIQAPRQLWARWQDPRALVESAIKATHDEPDPALSAIAPAPALAAQPNEATE